MPSRYFTYLAYDGAAYHGWQIQPNGISVQEVLQKALSTLLRTPIEVVGAGRTDAGVNASMMVAHWDFPTEELPMTPEQLTFRLAKILPPDIVVSRITPVPSELHARFSATSRTYRYFVATSRSPFHRHYSYFIHQPLDFEAMNKAAECLFQYTDFTSFSKLHTDVKTNNCRITHAAWSQQEPGLWVFEITADRFLRNMVRAIVGTLLDIGTHRINQQQFCEIIEKKNRCSAGTSVPGNALFLCNITYPL